MTTHCQPITCGSLNEPPIGFTRALNAGSPLVVSAARPVWADGSCSDDPALVDARWRGEMEGEARLP